MTLELGGKSFHEVFVARFEVDLDAWRAVIERSLADRHDTVDRHQPRRVIRHDGFDGTRGPARALHGLVSSDASERGGQQEGDRSPSRACEPNPDHDPGHEPDPSKGPGIVRY